MAPEGLEEDEVLPVGSGVATLVEDDEPPIMTADDCDEEGVLLMGPGIAPLLEEDRDGSTTDLCIH